MSTTTTKQKYIAVSKTLGDTGIIEEERNFNIFAKRNRSEVR